jgi:hypothetical protein
MSCEIGRGLNDAFAAATRALGEYVDSNEQIIKGSAYHAECERLERVRRETSFAFTEHRGQCTACKRADAL